MTESANNCSKCEAVIPHKRRVCLKCQKEAQQEYKKSLKTPHRIGAQGAEKLSLWND